jgi:hypothetical protein
LGVSPPAGVDDSEELAPILVIFTLRERVTELLQVGRRSERTHEIYDDLRVMGCLWPIRPFDLTNA